MEEAEEIIKERKRLARIDTYYPVKKIKEYDLNNLPDEEKFVEEIDSIIKGETQDMSQNIICNSRSSIYKIVNL